MTSELSEKQRRDILELIINDKPMKTGDMNPKDRNRLLALGFITLEPHPTSKRTQRITATEAAWAWAIDHFDEPFENTSLKPREIWNGLTQRLKRYLDERDENLATFLAEVASANLDEEAAGDAASYRLRAAYLRLTGGQLRRRVRLADLRREATMDRLVADDLLRALAREERIVLYPEDDGARLRPEDREAALLESGVAMHVVYWEV